MSLQRRPQAASPLPLARPCCGIGDIGLPIPFSRSRGASQPPTTDHVGHQPAPAGRNGPARRSTRRPHRRQRRRQWCGFPHRSCSPETSTGDPRLRHRRRHTLSLCGCSMELAQSPCGQQRQIAAAMPPRRARRDLPCSYTLSATLGNSRLYQLSLRDFNPKLPVHDAPKQHKYVGFSTRCRAPNVGSVTIPGSSGIADILPRSPPDSSAGPD